MQVGSATPSVAPSASSASSTSGTGFSSGLATPTVSATAARRSRFGGYSSRSLENLAALDVPAGDTMAGQVNRDKRFSLFNSCKFPALCCAVLCCAVLCCAVLQFTICMIDKVRIMCIKVGWKQVLCCTGIYISLWGNLLTLLLCVQH